MPIQLVRHFVFTKNCIDDQIQRVAMENGNSKDPGKWRLIYTHIVRPDQKPVKSPLDLMREKEKKKDKVEVEE